MKKIIVPVVLCGVLITSFATAFKTNRDRKAAVVENAVLRERLSRAEAVSASVLKIDLLYREAMDENAALKASLASTKRKGELRDAVSDSPRPKKRDPLRTIPLPGYGK